MCCDGSLFSNGLLVDDDEVGLARSLGMEILGGPEAGTSWKFRQPCACFQAGACAVYDQPKPGVCRTYRCELLDGYEADTIDLESCRDVVGWVQGLKHELEVEMGLAFGTFTYWHLVAYAITVRPHEEPERSPRFMLACNRYLELGRKFFRFPTADLAAIVADAEDDPVCA
jgi:hypothetical protein